jgi:hypothetical protein
VRALASTRTPSRHSTPAGAVKMHCSIQGGRVVLDAQLAEAYRKDVARMGWPDGTDLVLTLQPATEEWRHSDTKYLFGYLYRPFWNHYEGWTEGETHLHFKSKYLPDGKASLTELDREEMRAYIDVVRRDILENHPDIELIDPMGDIYTRGA